MEIYSGKLSRDWEGLPIREPLHCSLDLYQDGLLFSARQNTRALSHPESEPGCFQSHLWEYDCAELFLGERNSGSYLEVNLAPNSAWWACWMSEIRKTGSVQPDFDGIETKASKYESGWMAEIWLPLNLFKEPRELTFNICAILGSPSPSYLSLCELPGDTPDFHQPAYFRPLYQENDSCQADGYH